MEELKAKITTFELYDDNLIYKDNPSGKKRIFVYTPRGFNAENAKDYKVIYSFDGQNLFGTQIDGYKCSAENPVRLDGIIEESGLNYVAVGIDNGEGFLTRDRELTMSPDFGKIGPLKEGGNFECGTLEKTAIFVTEKLIPFISETFGIIHHREKVCVMGASSGGLAALYTGLKYSEVFGSIIALSPATALFYNNDWKNFFTNINPLCQKILVYCGMDTKDALEQLLYEGIKGENILAARDIKTFMLSCGVKNKEIFEHFLKGGLHNEKFWESALKQSVDFLK